jgi:hypothetical protein
VFFILDLIYYLTKLMSDSQPASMTIEDFRLYIKQSGPNSGLKCLELLSKNSDKTHKLSLGKSSLRDEKGFHDQIENSKDPLCIVMLYGMLRRHFPLKYKGTIFHHPMTTKKLLKLKRTPDADGFTRMADIDRPFGKNFFSLLCKRVATRCGMMDPDRHTANSRRRSGITQLVSSDVVVPSSEIMLAARHKSAITNAG